MDYVNYLNTALYLLSWAPIPIGIASVVVAATNTPDPNTTRGKIYRGVEIVALAIGKAKQTGIVPNNPAAEKISGVISEMTRELSAAPVTGVQPKA